MDQALENLQLSKIHLISLCQTQIGHFLKAYSVANDALPAVYDLMATCNIHQDKRDSLFTVQSAYLLKLMSCLEPPFMETYLRPSDKSNLLVSEVFDNNEKIISKVSIIDTKNADDFLESLHIDENGNLISTLNILNKTSHDILLNHHSKSTQGLLFTSPEF